MSFRSFNLTVLSKNLTVVFVAFYKYQILVELYKYKLAANTMSLLIILIASVNFSTSVMSPILLEAWTTCLNISSSRLIARIILPATPKILFENGKQLNRESFTKVRLLCESFKSSTKVRVVTSSLQKNLN